MPPSASSKYPLRASTAPVKEPFSWPNSSESIVPSGIAAQLTGITCGKNSLPTPLSPVTSTVRSVGATRRATSSALSRSGELPMMPKRCFTVVISVIYSSCSGWDAADGSSAACGSSMYSFSACFSRASRQSPKAMAATASRAAITAIQMNRSARRRGTRST